MKRLNGWPMYLTNLLIVGVLLITGCRGCREDSEQFPDAAATSGVALSVVATDPAPNETGVAVNKKIAITFSEMMNPLTVATGAITVTGPDGFPIAGTATSAGLVAVFTPAANLAANAIFTVTINTLARDLAGNGLKESYSFQFTTGAGFDLTAPNVVSTDPAAFARNVPLNQRISAPFSEGMDPTTINDNTFFLTGPAGNRVPVSVVSSDRAAITGNRVQGTVTFVGLTAIFTPASNLGFNTLYTATIKGGPGGVKDLAGNFMTDDYTWAFTGASPDTTAPRVDSTNPSQGDTNVAINKKMAFIFSEAMDPLTFKTTNFLVTGPGGAPVLGTVGYLGLIAKFTPTSFLAPNTVYTAMVKSGANGVKDLAGNALGSDFSVTFTTGATPDTTPPTVASTDPANGATGVPAGKILAVTFSEPMDPLTVIIKNFTLTGPGGAPVPGTVNYADRVALFAPSSSLAANTTYTATIGTGARDLAGYALAATYSWNFTTGLAPDLTAPTATLVYPASQAQEVGVKESVIATFSKGMDPSTISSSTFRVARFDGTAIVGSITYDATAKMARFTPATDLEEVTTYTATIGTGAKDLTGNPLASSTIWTFQTGQAPPVLGRASGFVMMATTKIDGTTGSNITGDVGVSPNPLSSITISRAEVNGNVYAAQDAAIVNAQTDMVSAYDNAALKAKKVVVMPSTDLGGLTLTPGLYKAAPSFDITSGDLTLDAQGNPNSVFIFQMPSSTLTVAVGRHVVLAGGAKAKNVFWQVGSSATLNSTTIFKGNIMANVSITVNSGSDVEGRLLAGVGTAGAGSVTFNSSTIYLPLP